MLEKLYPYLQSFHGVFRWFVLIFALIALVIAFSGWMGRKRETLLFPAGLAYVLAMDLELITGVLLYFSINSNARSVFIVHGVVMFLAVLCAHVGGAATRKAPTDALRHRVAAIAWVISLLLVFVAIPHP